jgi:hypothetical protein
VSELDEEPADDWLPGPEVTQALYGKWRDARRGVVNAGKMNNPVWDWLIRTRISAYTANRHFQGPDSLSAGPPWCFARYGQSRTVLPDGRTFFVAGEHEDSYDPDFFIYNDVVVRHPDDTIDVHGYPASDFPPTDFHSATLVGDRLILVGALGYAEDRKPGHTPVLSLDIHSLKIEKIETTGDNPGWIFQHSAVLENDCFLVRGGEVQDDIGALENIDDWLLELHSLRWKRLTDRQWPRFEFVRTDGEASRIWQIRHWLEMQEFYSQQDFAPKARERIRESLESLNAIGIPAHQDPQLIERLYRPKIGHDVVPREEDNFEEYNVYRIRIDGVVARYVEGMHSIVLTVEGQLSPATLDQLVSDLRDRLSQLEGVEFLVRRR